MNDVQFKLPCTSSTLRITSTPFDDKSNVNFRINLYNSLNLYQQYLNQKHEGHSLSINMYLD